MIRISSQKQPQEIPPFPLTNAPVLDISLRQRLITERADDATQADLVVVAEDLKLPHLTEST